MTLFLIFQLFTFKEDLEKPQNTFFFQFSWKVEFSFHFKVQRGESLLLSSSCIFVTVLVRFLMCYFWVTNKLQISVTHSIKHELLLPGLWLIRRLVLGYGLNSGLLYLSLILGPAADWDFLISWQMAKTENKPDHVSVLKAFAQNTSANFSLGKASHMAKP